MSENLLRDGTGEGQGVDGQAWRPRSDCSDCRIATLTQACPAGDVRGWQILSASENEKWARPYRTQVVQSEGPVPCPLVLVGEAPGQQEDRDGIPFNPAAPAGRELRKAMADVGLFRWSDVLAREAMRENGDRDYDPHQFYVAYLTNLLHCRPLDNKIDAFPDAVEVCRDKYLLPELAQLRPKAIVALGRVPAAYWFGKVGGAYRQLPDDGRPGSGAVVLHAPHPSSVARGNKPAYERLVKVLREAKVIAYE